MSRNIARYVRQLRDDVARLEVPQEVEQQFGHYRNDPVLFCREVLGVDSATRRSTGEPYQYTVLQDLAVHDRVAFRTGHGTGKSALDSWAMIWFLTTRPLSKVVVLAPQHQRQIVAVLFAEARSWVRRATVTLPLTVLSNRIVVDGHGPEWGAIGASTAGDPDRLEGFHAPGGLLLLIDEMKGVPTPAFDAVLGTLTGADAKLLVTSTPGGGGAGPFWKICVDGGDRWRVHHMSSEDSSLVRPEWCADMAKQWGLGSPLYESRVMGEFADAGESVLFPLPLIESAVDREVDADGDALGVDVARSTAGDLNCVARCRNGRLEIVATWRSADTMETTQKVVNTVTLTGCKQLAVDVGGPGGGVVDRLKELGHDVEAVHFGGAADDPQRFRNWRAAAFWTLREALERGEVSLPDDDELRADLSALRYQFTQDGRIQIEGKDECRKRLGRSPDRADAVALAFMRASTARRGSGLMYVGGQIVDLFSGTVVKENLD